MTATEQSFSLDTDEELNFRFVYPTPGVYSFTNHSQTDNLEIKVSGIRETRHVLAHGVGSYDGQIVITDSDSDTTTAIIDIDADDGPTYVGPVSLANLVTPTSDDLTSIQEKLGIELYDYSFAGREIASLDFTVQTATPTADGQVRHASGNDITSIVVGVTSGDLAGLNASGIQAITVHPQIDGAPSPDPTGVFWAESHTIAAGADSADSIFTSTGRLSDETTRAHDALDPFSLGAIGDELRLRFFVREPLTAHVPTPGSDGHVLTSDGSIAHWRTPNVSSWAKSDNDDEVPLPKIPKGLDFVDVYVPRALRTTPSGSLQTARNARSLLSVHHMAQNLMTFYGAIIFHDADLDTTNYHVRLWTAEGLNNSFRLDELLWSSEDHPDDLTRTSTSLQASFHEDPITIPTSHLVFEIDAGVVEDIDAVWDGGNISASVGSRSIDVLDNEGLCESDTTLSVGDSVSIAHTGQTLRVTVLEGSTRIYTEDIVVVPWDLLDVDDDDKKAAFRTAIGAAAAAGGGSGSGAASAMDLEYQVTNLANTAAASATYTVTSDVKAVSSTFKVERPFEFSNVRFLNTPNEGVSYSVAVYETEPSGTQNHKRVSTLWDSADHSGSVVEADGYVTATFGAGNELSPAVGSLITFELYSSVANKIHGEEADADAADIVTARSDERSFVALSYVASFYGQPMKDLPVSTWSGGGAPIVVEFTDARYLVNLDEEFFIQPDRLDADTETKKADFRAALDVPKAGTYVPPPTIVVWARGETSRYTDVGTRTNTDPASPGSGDTKLTLRWKDSASEELYGTDGSFYSIATAAEAATAGADTSDWLVGSYIKLDEGVYDIRVDTLLYSWQNKAYLEVRQTVKGGTDRIVGWASTGHSQSLGGGIDTDVPAFSVVVPALVVPSGGRIYYVRLKDIQTNAHQSARIPFSYMTIRKWS